MDLMQFIKSKPPKKDEKESKKERKKEQKNPALEAKEVKNTYKFKGK